MSRDPVDTNPGLYRVLFENDRVRVLEYRDRPGDETELHAHPDSVMVTLTSFRRQLVRDGRAVDVELGAGEARWLASQEHSGRNVGDRDSHAVFVELKEAGSRVAAEDQLGPSGQ